MHIWLFSFVYAGFDGGTGPNSVPFDTINVLTLPAFQWLHIPYTPQHPRIGHTCHAVGGSQVLIIGGADANPNISSDDYEVILKGQFSTPDPFLQGLAIFDMHELAFVDGYIASGPPVYESSDQVKQIYASLNQ